MTPTEEKALQAKRALQALREAIGPAIWLDRAIISCDAVFMGAKVGSDGRPIRVNNKPMTWAYMGLGQKGGGKNE